MDQRWRRRELGLDGTPSASIEPGELGIIFEGADVVVEVFFNPGLKFVLGALVANAESEGYFLELGLLLWLEGACVGDRGHDDG